MQLNRDQWTAETPLPHEIVLVPEIFPGGEALVWQLSGVERDEYDTTSDKMRGDYAKKGEHYPVSAVAVVFGVKDADGKRIFTIDDVPALAKRSGPALDRVWEAFHRQNRTHPAAQEAMQKNSEAASGGDSTTDSQENSVTST